VDTRITVGEPLFYENGWPQLVGNCPIQPGRKGATNREQIQQCEFDISVLGVEVALHPIQADAREKFSSCFIVELHEFHLLYVTSKRLVADYVCL